MRINNKAQATTELAIFGSLILVCFAVIVSYGQSLQEQQILQQQVFRKALKKAFDENAFVSYNIVKNPRTANVFGRYGEGGRSSTSAGASVNWNLGDPVEKSYYQVNEDEIEIPQDTELRDVETTAVTAYNAKETKAEDSAAITSNKKANLIDIITTRLRVVGKTGRMARTETQYVVTSYPDGSSIVNRVQADIPQGETSMDDIVITQGLDTDGRYRQSAIGTQVSKEREWVTPYAE